MTRLLLDTNVVSELRKVGAGRADENVAQWSASVDAGNLYISVVTVQELEIGVLRMERRDALQGKVLRDWLTNQVLPAFDRRILPVTQQIALAAARYHVPIPRSFQDGTIAATAHIHGMTIATRNIADFEPFEVALFNPFSTRFAG